jgi:DNA-binding YbaB/EbfC family protein
MSQQPSVEEIMAQAQRIQEELQKAQAKLEQTTIVGESGAGMVKITMTGRFAVTKVDFNDSVLSSPKQQVQDLVAAAINDAVMKVEKINQDSVASMMGGGEVSLSDTIKPRLS